jgi:hypothetical protein
MMMIILVNVMTVLKLWQLMMEQMNNGAQKYVIQLLQH